MERYFHRISGSYLKHLVPVLALLVRSEFGGEQVLLGPKWPRTTSMRQIPLYPAASHTLQRNHDIIAYIKCHRELHYSLWSYVQHCTSLSSTCKKSAGVGSLHSIYRDRVYLSEILGFQGIWQVHSQVWQRLLRHRSWSWQVVTFLPIEQLLVPPVLPEHHDHALQMINPRQDVPPAG